MPKIIPDIFVIGPGKDICESPKIGRIGRKWKVADCHIRPAVHVFDYLTLQFAVDLPHYLGPFIYSTYVTF
jgi:hypothetical protein